jgi:hypothetical protein
MSKESTGSNVPPRETDRRSTAATSASTSPSHATMPTSTAAGKDINPAPYGTSLGCMSVPPSAAYAVSTDHRRASHIQPTRSSSKKPAARLSSPSLPQSARRTNNQFYECQQCYRRHDPRNARVISIYIILPSITVAQHVPAPCTMYIPCTPDENRRHVILRGHVAPTSVGITCQHPCTNKISSLT